jgi:hypothetical protein
LDADLRTVLLYIPKLVLTQKKTEHFFYFSFYLQRVSVCVCAKVENSSAWKKFILIFLWRELLHFYTSGTVLPSCFIIIFRWEIYLLQKSRNLLGVFFSAQCVCVKFENLRWKEGVKMVARGACGGWGF